MATVRMPGGTTKIITPRKRKAKKKAGQHHGESCDKCKFWKQSIGKNTIRCTTENGLKITLNEIQGYCDFDFPKPRQITVQADYCGGFIRKGIAWKS